MISWSRALRLYLLETSDLRTWLGGPYVYKPQLPANPGFSMPHRAIVFRGNGGSSNDQLPIQRPTINFRIYGTSDDDAEVGYRYLHDRLVRQRNLIVTDTYSDPDQRVGFYNLREVTPGQSLEEPQTGYPFIFTVWSPTVATDTIAA